MPDAAKKVKPKGPFITYTEVEVEISAQELEREGWVFLGEPATTVERIAKMLMERHDTKHTGSFRFCEDILCREASLVGVSTDD